MKCKFSIELYGTGSNRINISVETAGIEARESLVGRDTDTTRHQVANLIIVKSISTCPALNSNTIIKYRTRLGMFVLVIDDEASAVPSDGIDSPCAGDIRLYNLNPYVPKIPVCRTKYEVLTLHHHLEFLYALDNFLHYIRYMYRLLLNINNPSYLTFILAWLFVATLW
jgi:hypothetical protein